MAYHSRPLHTRKTGTRPMMQRSRSTLLLAAVAFAHLAASGCGGSKAADAKTPTGDNLPVAIEHEPCDVSSNSAEKTDTNGDGKPDIVRVMSGGHEVCRMIDLNHDGKPDSYLYFEASGALRRRESDFDRDGNLDEIAHYAGGAVVRKDRETNLDAKFDTWDFYEAGQLHHRMRDASGAGKVDQWWTWPDPSKVDCAVIASDANGDGKPDTTGVVDVCAAAAAPASAPPGPAPAADAGAASATNANAAGDAGALVSPGSASRDADGGALSTASTNKGVR
jgi:hypothetical protein